MNIGKIFIRSLVGIITAGVVTILVGATLPFETMASFYGALAAYVYLDRDVSSDISE